MKLKFDWKALIAPAGLIALAVGYVALFSFMSGCSLADLIKVQVPSEMQRATGVGPLIPLSEANAVYERWEFVTRQASEQFIENAQEADQVFGFVSSLGSDLLEIAGPASATIPGGALLFGALTGAVGIFTKKPGTDKLIHKEKEGSYAKGLEEGKKAILESLRNGTPT